MGAGGAWRRAGGRGEEDPGAGVAEGRAPSGERRSVALGRGGRRGEGGGGGGA